MFKLTRIELIKIAAKPRSYIGFIAITVIVALIHIAMYFDGLSFINIITQPLDQSLLIEGKILNGNLVCFIILQMLIVHVPLLIALVTGDLISGEAAAGTIRLLATKPVSRSRIVWAKFFAGCVYTFFILLWLGILALALGLFIFGKGDLIVLKSDGLVILQQDDTLWRFFSAFALAFLALILIASFSLALSAFAENSIGPIISTMAVIILFTIIGTLEVPMFDKIKPYLFTTHMLVWRNMFDSPLQPSDILNSVFVLIAHILVFLSVTLYWFRRKDILS